MMGFELESAITVAASAGLSPTAGFAVILRSGAMFEAWRSAFQKSPPVG